MTDFSDSPELGPPPVARFEQVDPVKKPSPLLRCTFNVLVDNTDNADDAANVEKVDNAGNAEVSKNLFSNLETRRKRRESATEKSSDKTSTEKAEPNAIQLKPAKSSSSEAFNTGSKRKLNARDSEDRPTISQATNKDGFAFSRRAEAKVTASKEASLQKSKQETENTKPKQGAKARAKPPSVIKARKALSNST